MSQIRILIADDHAVLRAGIRALLDLQADLWVVGEAGDGHQALLRVRELQPDIVLMDLGMSGMDGLTAMREIKASWPHVRVLILTQHENKEYILPALKLGASGYVLKRAEGDELLMAIRSVYAGETFFDPAINVIIVDDMRRIAQSPSDPLETLSAREREVMMLLASGLTYQQVAETLFISVKTVDFHRANVLRKLDLTSRTDLTKYAVQRGLIG